MRRRATFIHDAADDFNPADIQLKGRQLLHPGLNAAREERLTFGFNELPSNIVKVLQKSHELHIRWVSEFSYDVATPFLSSLTPGLHVHYTPADIHQEDLLCPLLSTLSGRFKCHTAQSSFIQPSLLSNRFASSAALQYYSVLRSLTNLVAWIQRHICADADIMCLHTAGLLNAVDYVDFDYDSISHALTITAFWSRPLPVYYDPIGGLTFLDQWPLDISSSKNDKVEVGILTSSKAADPHELQMSGYLMIVGESDEPKPTLFEFPSRHHSLPLDQAKSQSFTAAFEEPVGLHPSLKIKFPSASLLSQPSNKPKDSICALHAYLTLPSSIFIDEYAFPTSTSDSDPLFQQANNIISLRAIAGELDLEAPDYVVDRWGSIALLELATPSSISSTTSKPTEWTVTIPMHLRYQPPSDTGHMETKMPWPIIFWACTAEDGTKFPTNPFDRTHLGYDGLFGPRTMFYHVPAHANNSRLVENIQVPILQTGGSYSEQMIETGTVVTVLLGFLCVLVKLWPAITNQIRLSTGDDPSDTPAEGIKDDKKTK